MILRFAGTWTLMMLIVLVSVAQEDFSDEDLTKYATVMNWAKDKKAELSANISSSINENELLPGSVYNKLKKALEAGDVNSTDASETEVNEFLLVQKRIESLEAQFKTMYVDKIKNDIGAGLYNQLRKALKSNEEVKSRYDAILKEIESASLDAEDSEE